MWWTLPLSVEQQTHIKIPHLEFLAAVINFVLFARTKLPPTPDKLNLHIVSHMDGLAARQVLASKDGDRNLTIATLAQLHFFHGIVFFAW